MSSKSLLQELIRCHIQHIDNDAFFNVRNLSVLILTGNQVKYFGRSSINILEKMEKLVLVDIGLLSLDSLNLQNLTSLKELNFGTNRLFSLALPTYAVSFKNFTLLDLHTNNISVIRAVHTSALRQMGSNITLILSRNPIAFIETGAFTGLYLGEIHLLDIFISSTKARVITGGLNGLNVKRLKIGNSKEMGKLQTNSDYFDSLCFMSFQEVFFQTSVFSEVPSHILGCMSNCTKIYLVEVGIKSREHFYFPNLEEITMINIMSSLPDVLLSHQQNLNKLVITNSRVTGGFNFVGLPNLEYIDLSHNSLVIYCCDSEFIGIPKLRYLNLSNNLRITIRSFEIFVNHSSLEVLDLRGTEVMFEGDYSAVMQSFRNLKTLDLSYSQIIFKMEVIFHCLSSLKELNIAGNGFAKDILSQLFLNLTALEVLDISFCAIEDIPLASFQDLHQLKHLILSGNRLTTLDFLIGPILSKLQSLHLDKNHISTISSKLLQILPTDILFDLSLNPIECSCSEVEFISWIINHQSVLKHPQLMSCNPSSMNSRVIDFDSTHCVYMKRVITTVLCFSAMILFIFFIWVYKYQFYFRYFCILLKGYRTSTSTQEECSYDAFVIYSSKDETWVVDELMENLEKGVPPIQLCLHERDFKVGKPITSNILDEGIMSSRKVIVVVSQHFLDSAWCQFEFELAQSWLVLGQTTGIIIIILENVEDRKIKKVFGLHKYLKKNTYLKWKENELSNVRFWTRLRKAVIARN